MAQDYPQAWCNWEPSSMRLYQSYQMQQQPYEVEPHAQPPQPHEREHMFEKPLTPSDVGKLNRLVIPKQHAEKYFPLDAGGGAGGDSSGEKGLLLNFEDESGKHWRFRYSYWTSSQSYVLTKGWSRFVKEKRLDAGDFVLFGRLRTRRDRLFIGCRRRGANRDPPESSGAVALSVVAGQWSSASACYIRVSPSGACAYPGSGVDHRDEGAKSDAVAPANGKRLRLFGVNLDFGPETEAPCLSSPSWFSDRDLGQFMAANAANPSQY